MLRNNESVQTFIVCCLLSGKVTDGEYKLIEQRKGRSKKEEVPHTKQHWILLTYYFLVIRADLTSDYLGFCVFEWHFGNFWVSLWVEGY